MLETVRRSDVKGQLPMIDIPILRHGKPYFSVEKTTLVHHATGEPVATVSQANSGLIVRDIHRMDDRVLEAIPVADLLGICRRAAHIFMHDPLPLGDPAGPRQSFDEYVRQLSATTGMPHSFCRNNAGKVHKVLAEIDTVVAGLTRGFDPGILDRGWGMQDGRTLSFFREGRIFGAVLPSNSPGVHTLWIPAVALKTPIVLKPGREEPWTPLRVIEALAAAGMPRAAFGFYPTDHGGAGELLRNVNRAMLFGDASTTKAWKNDPRIEIHGPGYSKILLGDDAADNWEKYLDVMALSIAANGGRSCVNASAIWTPRHGRKIADALATRLSKIEALPADDPRAELAAFANPKMPELISASIDAGLREPGAIDLTHAIRGTSRLETRGRVAYLLPTIVWIDPSTGDAAAHPLANREFLFPYASVIECPTAEMPARIGQSLVVTAISRDPAFISALLASPHVDRLNLGPIATMQLSWDQPHEGNLFEHLYRQRSFQIETAA
jgi:hypothetical protein